jgi:hypothetical protein
LKRINAKFGCLIVCIIAIGCIEESVELSDHRSLDEDTSGPAVPDDWNFFHSTDPAFAIAYPPNWHAWQQDRMLTIEPATKDAAVTVGVHRTDLSLEEAAEIAIQAGLRDAKAISERKSVVVNNVRGYTQDFHRVGPTGHTLWLTLFLLHDGRFASITLNGPEAKILRNRQSWEAIMRSFTFLDN